MIKYDMTLPCFDGTNLDNKERDKDGRIFTYDATLYTNKRTI